MMAQTDASAALILASASPVRAALLRAAGLAIEVKPVGIDEDSVTSALLEEAASAREIAETLAELKAIRAAAKSPQWVIGADQVLSCEGVILRKAKTPEELRQQLQTLRAKKHELASAIAIARNGSVIWRHIETATLQMRDFSPEFLDLYIDRNKDSILANVGGYQLEGEGVQLFDWIKGDYFTILGLPLLPVLDFLRTQGVLQT